MIFKLVGGIGLFLLGMVLLTDGVKAFAGDSLKRALLRFTGAPWKAFCSGTLVTALVQSSSATTVTVIGFVSAGLLSFPQALGVVFGASLGTTGTGWIVALFGLKVSLSFYAMPLIGVGALMKLLAPGRWRVLGLALAGFGLIFVGIETLQTGMQVLASVFNLAALPSEGFWGHLLTMFIGIMMTIIMQSSSAAVAITLTALSTGVVNFEQASSLVIGAAVGTTLTGALAAIGGSVPAKRTALAHILFNLATGLIAVILLPLFLKVIIWAQTHLGLDPGATSLAAFHTFFILVGVAIFLPFVDQFAHRIEKLLPEKGSSLTRHLDSSLLNMPSIALEATRRAMAETAIELFKIINQRLERHEGQRINDGSEQSRIEEALGEIRTFLAGIPALVDYEPLSQLRLSLMHSMDHLTRLETHLYPPAGMQQLFTRDSLKGTIENGRKILSTAQSGLETNAPSDWREQIAQMASDLAAERRQDRSIILEEAAQGVRQPDQGLEILDVMRWLDRVGYHTWRVSHYLGGIDPGTRSDTPASKNP